MVSYTPFFFPKLRLPPGVADSHSTSIENVEIYVVWKRGFCFYVFIQIYLTQKGNDGTVRCICVWWLVLHLPPSRRWKVATWLGTDHYLFTQWVDYLELRYSNNNLLWVHSSKCQHNKFIKEGFVSVQNLELLQIFCAMNVYGNENSQ